MRLKSSKSLTAAFAVVALAVTVLAPATAQAQSWRDQEAQHRKNQQNQWRNLTIGSAAAALIGVVTKNKALTIAGAAGALYSGYRLSQDGKDTRSRSDRDRYERDRQRERDRIRQQQDYQRQYDQNYDTQYYRDPHANPDGRMIAGYNPNSYQSSCNKRDKKNKVYANNRRHRN